LMAIEFGRMVFGQQLLHSGVAGVNE
jgi:hypothetical protein